METAGLAERLGYHRIWFAEHHNTPNLAASATSLLISQAASVTERIRLGSGGVMLPNHAPLMVAEQYGTLANMHGDRIDLGLGRAPGTDGMTAQALGRSSAEPQAFAQHIFDMQGWFGETGTAHSSPIQSAVSLGTRVPVWVLGSPSTGRRSPASWVCRSRWPRISRPTRSTTPCRSTATRSPPRHPPRRSTSPT